MEGNGFQNDHSHIEEDAKPERPAVQTAPSQMSTQYVNMLLALDAVPRMHNWMASFFTWILLAGFVIFPGTFSSISEIQVADGTIESRVLHAVQNIPLYAPLILSGITRYNADSDSL